MISIQAFIEHKHSVYIVFDKDGIDEFIRYLEFIKNKDSSMHLNAGNELGDEIIFQPTEGGEMYIIPHLKIINLDKLDQPS